MGPLNRAAAAYIAAVVLFALATVATAARLAPLGNGQELSDCLVLLLLYAFADSLHTRRQVGVPTLAVGAVVGQAALPIVGPAAAVVVALGAALEFERDLPWVKRLFNSAMMVLSTAGAGLAYLGVTRLLGASSIYGAQSSPIPTVLSLLVASIVYSVLNAFLLANVLHYAQGVPRKHVVNATLRKLSVIYLGYSLFGLLLAVLWRGAGIGPLSALLVLVPLLVARWVFGLYVAEQQAYERTVRALVRAVETKDLYTRQHGERVSKAAVMIARRSGMRQDRLEMLRYAGFLHDVGKLGVPTRVLQKSGKLSEAEFGAVALHPLHGFEIVSGIEFLGEAHDGIRHHHERLDGRGYPSGLKGEEIPEFARILAVADAFDAMTSTRSYRGARPVPEALLELERCKGTQFEPAFVDLLAAAVADEGWAVTETVPPLTLVASAETAGIPFQRDHDEPLPSSVEGPAA